VASGFPEGFGVLIPRDQGYRMLGCIWDSQLFKGRAPAGHLLVRAMLGGAVDPEVAGLGDEGLVELTRREIGSLFGVTAEPLYAHVANWSRAIPQYDLGHPGRVAHIEANMKASPGVFLAGNGLYGVAFAKSAVTGIRQGRAATRWLGAPETRDG
jgi:oxygen-dependent protoporphyrinogen oxidase